MGAKGAKFAVFFDGLRKLGSDSDISMELQLSITHSANQVWIASPALWPEVEVWGRNFRVVGQPTLKNWQNLRRQDDVVRRARVRLYGEDAVASSVPAIVWFGGYGDGYEAALRTWCRVAKKFSKLH